MDQEAPPFEKDSGQFSALNAFYQNQGPFLAGDTTIGTEIELHAVVIGSSDTVDLAQFLRESGYYANLVKRSSAQDSPKRAIRALERFLNENIDQVWDNSWVQLETGLLSDYAKDILEQDLLADKSDPDLGKRQDLQRFKKDRDGKDLTRLPVSYLIKLSLADYLGREPILSEEAIQKSKHFLSHFLNDHSSPESFSLYLTELESGEDAGKSAAEEVLLRFLLTQLVTMHANRRLGLSESGQHAVVYFSPSPAMRQRQLNECVSDSFYRDLFSSPCLSGWDQGEEKRDYMRLCHEVLSRSQLNAVAKIRDADLIFSNLVVLPNMSNTSLANNGVHVSIGSKSMTKLARDGKLSEVEEKQFGDLVIKLTEHFLPLFVGTYSAAPYRFDYADFHPERVLNFLPHELDFTHLRMFWRRWKKKARNRFLGQGLTPTGYEFVDQFVGAMLRLKGDFLPDQRLVDYLIAPLSTDQSPALNGEVGNLERLTVDLDDQGIFDRRMPLYMLYRLRSRYGIGYTGFEGRYYSLFESISQDLSKAIAMQNLVTACVSQMVLNGKWTHEDVPDDPTVESERRQIFFGAAVELPTFYVQKNTSNRFLKALLENVEGMRNSHRYTGYLRVKNRAYRQALVKWLKNEAGSLIAELNMSSVIEDLEKRLDRSTGHSVSQRLTDAIMRRSHKKNPLKLRATEFNQQSERFYREVLRRKHLDEALDVLENYLSDDSLPEAINPEQVSGHLSGGLSSYLKRIREAIRDDVAGTQDISHVLSLTLAVIHERSRQCDLNA